jgi:hypothetical protein
MKLLILLSVLFVIGCSGDKIPEYTLVVLGVYLEDVKANDGAVERDWMTNFHIIETDSRQISTGKWGCVGDTLRNMAWNGYYFYGKK